MIATYECMRVDGSKFDGNSVGKTGQNRWPLAGVTGAVLKVFCSTLRKDTQLCVCYILGFTVRVESFTKLHC